MESEGVRSREESGGGLMNVVALNTNRRVRGGLRIFKGEREREIIRRRDCMHCSVKKTKELKNRQLRLYSFDYRIRAVLVIKRMISLDRTE